jgi:hypothetical protein
MSKCDIRDSGGFVYMKLLDQEDAVVALNYATVSSWIDVKTGFSNHWKQFENSVLNDGSTDDVPHLVEVIGLLRPGQKLGAERSSVEDFDDVLNVLRDPGSADLSRVPRYAKPPKYNKLGAGRARRAGDAPEIGTPTPTLSRANNAILEATSAVYFDRAMDLLRRCEWLDEDYVTRRHAVWLVMFVGRMFESLRCVYAPTYLRIDNDLMEKLSEFRVHLSPLKCPHLLVDERVCSFKLRKWALELVCDNAVLADGLRVSGRNLDELDNMSVRL